MTEPDQALIARLSSDVAAIGAYLARASADLRQLEYLAATRSVSPVAVAAPVLAPPLQPPRTPEQPVRQAPQPRSDGGIGKALAVAGVAVTLIGVALLLVLAAQAGILRPEFRVAAGAMFAAGLVGAGWRLNTRPGGRVGAIALAATGIAAAYIDVIATTTIYDWVSAPVGLAIAAIIALAGFTLARRWDSEHLGVLVLVPLIVLAPVVTDGMTVLLVGFMLALSAAALPVQLGKDWIGMHGARIAAGTLPLLVALAGAAFDSGTSPVLASACVIAAVLAIGSALLLLRHTTQPTVLALLSAAGTTPLLSVALVVDRAHAAVLIGALAGVMLAIVLVGERLPMVGEPVRAIWSGLSAVSALIAILVAFDGPVAGPLLLAMAVVIAIAGGRHRASRWSAVGFGVVGAAYYLHTASVATLFHATTVSTPIAVSTLISSVLLVVGAVVIARTWPGQSSWAAAAAIAVYALAMFTVTFGVLVAGAEYGFFAGHMVATICWIALAAAVLRYALKMPRAQRSLPIGGGMALVSAAIAKLFLFDLGTLDGIFRVAVFIVVGLVLLGMGTGYARMLAQQDDREPAV